jgi:heme/copper-type cytochrome/quinol oxidase subunit 2
VAVRVMRIRYVRMHMPQRLVTMPVAVRSGRHRNMHMVMVAIVVAVRVLVFHHVVFMLVAVRLRQVQHHPCQHQGAARRHQPTRRLVA